MLLLLSENQCKLYSVQTYMIQAYTINLLSVQTIGFAYMIDMLTYALDLREGVHYIQKFIKTVFTGHHRHTALLLFTRHIYRLMVQNH